VSPDRAAADQFLLDHGADGIEHPGGTLYAHLVRVADRLAAWAAADDVVLAGLCHATYGTAGFAPALLPVERRSELVDVIGPAAEAVVYLYAGCDRAATYPLLGGTGPVQMVDRFSGPARTVEPGELRAFMEITVANELDVLAQNADYAARYGPPLMELFTRAQNRMSQAAWTAVQAARLSPATE
jgi:hypothetical protein